GRDQGRIFDTRSAEAAFAPTDRAWQVGGSGERRGASPDAAASAACRRRSRYRARRRADRVRSDRARARARDRQRPCPPRRARECQAPRSGPARRRPPGAPASWADARESRAGSEARSAQEVVPARRLAALLLHALGKEELFTGRDGDVTRVARDE